jgi:hypothetical protein
LIGSHTPRLCFGDDQTQEAQIKEKHEWCKRFFYCDGFHHILNLVLHDDFLTRNQGSRAFKSCLRLLLKIIHFFIQGGSIARALARLLAW